MPTPPDQGSSEADVRITQSGVVTLRGPVESDQEKATVLAAARGAPGVRSVSDELDVTAQR